MPFKVNEQELNFVIHWKYTNPVNQLNLNCAWYAQGFLINIKWITKRGLTSQRPTLTDWSIDKCYTIKWLKIDIQVKRTNHNPLTKLCNN